MNIHEYQAKELLAKHGVAVQGGFAARSVAGAVEAMAKLPGPLYIVKAQIHAGGRGAGRFANDPGGKGGVRLARTRDEVRAAAQAMLGQTLITKQTGPEGRTVRRLLIADGVDIEQEYYCAVLLDRASARVAFVVSPQGGMDIEEVAEKTPEAITRITVDPAAGFQPFHARVLCRALGLAGPVAKSGAAFFRGLYDAFMAADASIVEVNPMIVTAGGQVLALDAKVTLDDNGLYRHPALAAYRDEYEEEERERAAHAHDLSYVALDGDIGCMVNGAGLAMATMDIIKLHGGAPANFLDVGGGANAAKVAAAFQIILSDPAVRGILVNIFGGIMRCDIIAQGIVDAARGAALAVPLVVRLEGTNVDAGKAILAGSGLPIIAADCLEDAAARIVAATGQAKAA
jgi:succinyl-CoA synthetase beta subunit